MPPPSAEAYARLRAALDTAPPHLLVVGDVMLDRYLWGSVERISPEAPVPVLRLTGSSERLGGAANVAANLAGLGAAARLVGPVGDDADAQRLAAMLADLGIGEGLVRDGQRPTITKTRIVGGHQQMLRLDQEADGPHAPAAQTALLQAALAALESLAPAALILSDYAKGALPPATCQALIQRARALGIPVLVDPKGRDYSKYRGATALTPNLKEAAEACGLAGQDSEALLAGVAKLRAELALDYVVLTRGEAGMSLVAATGIEHVATAARQVFDVSGAGDTVIATLALAVAAGLAPLEACRLANLAAGIVVGKVGTSPVALDELRQEVESRAALSQADKIASPAALAARIAEWRRRGEQVVFTNGCFDLLHAGHVSYLEQARQLGDRLVVGLNTDRSVSALKGPGRPVIHAADRARVLAALAAVDAVCLFDQDTPLDLIKALRPDILVKGDDYREDQVVGAAEVKAWGGRVALLPVVQGRSTSGIIRKLQESEE